MGDGKIRLDGAYLSEAIKACSSMVDLKLVDGKSPMLFSSTGYELVVMPMITGDNQPPKVEEKPAEPETEQPEVEEAEKADVVAEAEAITKAKPKRKHKAKEPVTV